MSQGSEGSTPFLSPRGSPPPPDLTAVMALTTRQLEEPDDYVSTDHMMLSTNDDIEWHLERRNFARSDWQDDGFIPTSEDRCGKCEGCRSGTCLAALNKYGTLLQQEQIRCLNCDNKKGCILRTGADGKCDDWKPHMIRNHAKALYDLNLSLKKKYVAGQLKQVQGDEGWFVAVSPEELPAYTSENTIEQQLGAGGAAALGPGGAGSNTGQQNASNNIDPIKLQAALQGLTDSIKQVDNVISQISNNVSTLGQEQQRQGKQLSDLGGAVNQQQQQHEELRREVMLLQRKPLRPGEPSAPPVFYTPPAGPEGGRPDAINRLAEALEKNLTPTKPSIRLPAFSLPKLVGAQNGKIQGAFYWSWRARCQKLIAEHDLPENLAISLIVAEPSLPAKYKAQIANSATLDGLWAVLDSMSPPLQSLLPQLIRDLTTLDNAWTQEEQIKSYDKILIKLSQIVEFFPSSDIDFSVLTATLATFCNPDSLSQMPDTLAKFQQKKGETGETFVQLLQEHCQKRRADLHSIVTSLALYRPEQMTPHNNIYQYRNGGKGNNGGNGGNGGNGQQRGANNKPEKMSQHYSGGSAAKPGRCYLCEDNNSKHWFLRCEMIKKAKEGTVTLKNSCLKCLRPKSICATATQGNESKPCHVRNKKAGDGTYSVLCEFAGHNHHAFICKETSPKRSVPHNWISVECDEFADGSMQGSNPTVPGGTSDVGEQPALQADEKRVIDARQDVNVCYMDCRTKNDSPDVLFLIQKLAGRIQNCELDLTVVYDGAAAISCILLPAHMIRKFKANRKKTINLATANGQSSQTHSIFDVLIYGNASDFLFNVVQLQGLPLPHIRSDCRRLFQACGNDFLPTNFEVKNNVYLLLGLPHLKFHPVAVRQQLVPSAIREKYNSLRCFASRLDGRRMFAGCLSGSRGGEGASGVMYTATDRERELLPRQHCSSPLRWGQEDQDNVLDCVQVWEDERAGSAESEDWEEGYLDDDIYMSDDEGSIYYSDEDEEDWEEEREDYWFAEEVQETSPRSVNILHHDGREVGEELGEGEESEYMEGAIMHPGEETGLTSQRIFFEKQNSHIKALYRDFLREQSAAFSANRVDIGCQRCDPSLSVFGNMPALRSFQLKHQISFEQIEEGGRGCFVYDRPHLPSISSLPSGIKLCANRLSKTALTLEKFPHTRQYMNHSLARDFIGGKLKWYRDIPENLRQGLQVHVTPTCLIKNLKSNSTLIRLVLAANTPMPSLCDQNCPCKKKVEGNKGKDAAAGASLDGQKVPNISPCNAKLTLNQTIPSFECTLPQISTLAMAARLAIIASGGDILRFFTNVRQTLKTSLRNALIFYRCQDTGYPCFSPTTSKGVTNPKEILTCVSNYFGLTDLPQACSRAVAMAVPTYMEHLNSEEARQNARAVLVGAGMKGDWIVQDTKMREIIIQMTRDTLDHLYIDDWPHMVTWRQCSEMLQCMGIKCDEWSSEKLCEVSLMVQERTASFAILALNHCSFDLKNYDTSSVNEEKINKLISMVKHEIPSPNVLKPTNEQVRSEYKQREVECNREIPGSDPKMAKGTNLAAEKPFLVQLGMEYYRNGECRLRAQTLKLYGAKSKSKITVCHSVADYDRWLAAGEGAITRRHLAQILGQCFAMNVNNHHLFSHTLIKFATATTVKSGKPFQWEDSIDTSLHHLIRAAVRFYFVSAASRQERCALKHTMHCIFVLHSSSDSGGSLHCHNHHLIQILRIGEVTRNIVQPLCQYTLLNQSKIVSLPHLELIGLAKAVHATTKLFVFLKEQGILIHTNNILIASDSASALAMCKCPPPLLENRFAHVVSRICMQLLTINLTPHQCLYYHLQTGKNREGGEPYISDVCSKVNIDWTEDDLMMSFPRQWNEALQWMYRPPDTWAHILRNPNNKATKALAVERFVLTEAPMTALLSEEKHPITQINLLDTQMQKDKKVTFDSKTQHHTQGPSTPFDGLLLRKFGKINSNKSAFHIIILVKWYIEKLKKIAKKSTSEKNKIREDLKRNLKQVRGFDAFLPKCKLRCGLVDKVACGGTHHIVKFKFFSTNNNLVENWPDFGPAEDIRVSNIIPSLIKKVEELDWQWGEKHEFYLREYTLTALASHVSQGAVVKNMQMFDLECGNTVVTMACGRRQARCIGGKQEALGSPLFRTAHPSVFALCVVRWHHLAGDHNKIKARLSLLQNGWIFQDLTNVLRSAQQMCMQCRKQNATNAAKNTSLYTTVSGHAFNLGMLAWGPNHHTLAVDAAGPFIGLHGTKYWCYAFLSHLNGMLYTMTVTDLSIETLVHIVEQLSSNIGSIKVIISDQQSSFSACANVMELEGTLDEERPVGRNPRQPLAKLLEKSPIEGGAQGICWKIVGANSGEFMGQIEKYIFLLKQALRHIDFQKKCDTFSHSQMSAYFAVAAKCINSRPSLVLSDGKVYSPYDLLRLSLLGGGCPESDLCVSTDNKQIRDKLKAMASLKRSLQTALYTKFTEQLYFGSAVRQRATFEMHSRFLQQGDLILYNKAFEITGSFVKSIRRIAFLDIHRKHAVVYHLIDPEIEFDVHSFTERFQKCKSKAERQKLVAKELGRHSFESIDLRKCSFVAKQEEGPNIDCFFRRSKDQSKIHPIEDDTVFSLSQTSKLFHEKSPGASAVLSHLPPEAIQIASQEWQKTRRVHFKEQEPDKVEPEETRNEERSINDGSCERPRVTRSGRVSRPPMRLDI